jgi:DNA repair photolyase
MIISVSRRTDIPAYFPQWFIKRVEEGFVYVRNPFSYHQVSKVLLGSGDVDCFVFWTKDPLNLIDHLKEIKNYSYYFQFTVTPYGKDIEPGIRDKSNIIKTFKELSLLIGKEKVVWRYDPVIFTEKMDIEYHIHEFEWLMDEIGAYCAKLVISFFDLYKGMEEKVLKNKIISISETDIKVLAHGFSKKAEKIGLRLETCAEKADLSEFGIEHGSCVDARIISSITGKSFSALKDKNQREFCGCIGSIDIGSYDSCPARCIYCYANHSEKKLSHNISHHIPDSPLLTGEVLAEDKIYERTQLNSRQPRLNF